ncbi:MAG TPA: GPW/gp25 family protein [Allosphingosinicella sp.]|jgi:phage baseplate assembly protein W|nr:GPW/gp25 family protein [Allosphingosinicella sp.]
MNIAFPLQFDDRGRTAGRSGDDHIRDMIELLLFTNPGERVNRPDFGSGLLQLIFAANSPEVAAALQLALQAAIDRWLGDLVEVRRLDVRSDDARLTVDITYAVRRTGQVVETSFERTAP